MSISASALGSTRDGTKIWLSDGRRNWGSIRSNEQAGFQERSQLVLTLALAKRPELLVLDEPVASLDPLARRDFMQQLMAAVAEHKLSVILSSHLIADLEHVCDYLVVLAASRVQLPGEVEGLLASHRMMSGPRRHPLDLPADHEVIEASHTDRQSTLLVRSVEPVLDPSWTVTEVSLESLVLAYMSQARTAERTQRFELTQSR